MKISLAIIRLLVGLLFVFSGLVKANDPLGLSYKMQEFFENWNEGLAKGTFFLNSSLVHLFDFLHQHSLSLSVIMIGLEIIAGIALLLGWRMKLVSWFLLLLIIFFTFLTGYAFLSGKFKNCGCFGDCLPITPLASFLKDVLLTVLIVFLFINREMIKPLFIRKTNAAAILLFSAMAFGIQWYTLTYLPVVDCLPLKKGNNIEAQMKIPAGAVPDSFAIRFIYERNGKQFEFSPSDLPADLDQYKFKQRTDKLIRKGNSEPPLKGFALLTMQDEDSTQAILSNPGYSVFYFTTPDEDGNWKVTEDLSKTLQEATGRGLPVYAISTNADVLKKQFEKENWNYPVFKLDYTAFRTAARANPVVYLIKNGTVKQKWPLSKMNDALNYISGLKQ